MTSDNASNNDSAMKEVAREIDPEGTRWMPDARRIRCQEHILNLTARHFVDGIAPTSHAALLKKIRQALDNGNDADLDALNKRLASMETNSDEMDDEETFDSLNAGDSLGRALALIEQVCAIAILSSALTDNLRFSDSEIPSSSRVLQEGLQRRECS